jgi:hypothetical protein
MALAEQAAHALWGNDQKAWGDRLEVELSNLRSALAWCMGEIADRSIGTKTDDVRTELGESAAGWMIDPAEIALRFSWALFRFWEARGHGDEGGRWLNTILDAVPMPMPIRVDALNAAVYLAGLRGDVATADARHREATELATTIAYRFGAYLSAVFAAGVAMTRGDATGAVTALNLAESLLCRAPDMMHHYIGQVLYRYFRGALCQALGQFSEAERWLHENLAIERAAGDQSGEAHSLTSLGNLAFMHSDLADSESKHRRALTLLRDLGDRNGGRPPSKVSRGWLGQLGATSSRHGCSAPQRGSLRQRRTSTQCRSGRHSMSR